MKEIKFRFWDNKSNTMLDWSAIKQTAFNNGGTNLMYDLFTNKLEGILMQYTGLKDKNGKEIYEWDIVNYGDNYPSIVTWTNEGEGGIETCGYFLVENGKGEKWEKFYPRHHTLFCQNNLIEVLGNIYENPELIKK